MLIPTIAGMHGGTWHDIQGWLTETQTACGYVSRSAARTASTLCCACAAETTCLASVYNLNLTAATVSRADHCCCRDSQKVAGTQLDNAVLHAQESHATGPPTRLLINGP